MTILNGPHINPTITFHLHRVFNKLVIFRQQRIDIPGLHPAKRPVEIQQFPNLSGLPKCVLTGHLPVPALQEKFTQESPGQQRHIAIPRVKKRPVEVRHPTPQAHPGGYYGLIAVLSEHPDQRFVQLYRRGNHRYTLEGNIRLF